MRNKSFIVTHAKAKFPIVIKGPTIEEACEKEGLDPNFWKPLREAQEVEEEPDDSNKGDAGEETD